MNEFKEELDAVMRDSEDYLKKLDEEKEPEISQGMLDLTKKVIELKERHAKLKNEAAEVWLQKESLEQNLLDQMESLGLKNFRHKELGLISVAQRIWARITDVEKAREHFERDGIADQLLGYRLKKEGGQKRLNEIVKECIESGKVVPDGLDFSSRAMIRISQG